MLGVLQFDGIDRCVSVFKGQSELRTEIKGVAKGSMRNADASKYSYRKSLEFKRIDGGFYDSLAVLRYLDLEQVLRDLVKAGTLELFTPLIGLPFMLCHIAEAADLVDNVI